MYWNERFAVAGSTTVDWYSSYNELREIFRHLFGTIPCDTTRPDRVLVIGCGNSDLSFHLHSSERFDSVLSIDISDVVIAQMRSRYPHLPFDVVDCTRLRDHFSAVDRFDYIIDKGTFDALLCGSKDGASAMLAGVSNFLGANGSFIIVSNRADRSVIIEEVESLYVQYIWRCDLSDQAILINVLFNSKIDEKLVDLYDRAISPEVMMGCRSDVRDALLKKACGRCLRDFMFRKGNTAASKRSILLFDIGSPDREYKRSQLPTPSARTNYCFTYVVRRR